MLNLTILCIIYLAHGRGSAYCSE